MGWHQLAHRTEFEGIELLLWHTAVAIDPTSHAVAVVDREERRKTLPYDQLLIATGAGPLLPGADAAAPSFWNSFLEPAVASITLRNIAPGRRPAKVGRATRTGRVFNVVKEFWPDIRHSVLHQKY